MHRAPGPAGNESPVQPSLPEFYAIGTMGTRRGVRRCISRCHWIIYWHVTSSAHEAVHATRVLRAGTTRPIQERLLQRRDRPDDEDPYQETFTNPTVLFEVVSERTEGYDRGLKAWNYRQIESLKAYLMVSPRSPHVEIYERQEDGSWRLRETRGLGTALTIPAIGIELPLAEIYDRVEFAAGERPESVPPRGSNR